LTIGINAASFMVCTETWCHRSSIFAVAVLGWARASVTSLLVTGLL
jgi:hypothetical protein